MLFIRQALGLGLVGQELDELEISPKYANRNKSSAFSYAEMFKKPIWQTV